MTDNPLLDGKSTRPGRVALETLENMVMRYNQAEWVKRSGKPYFVGKRAGDDGVVVHFLDRNG